MLHAVVKDLPRAFRGLGTNNLDYGALALFLSNPQRSGRRLNSNVRGAVEAHPDLWPVYMGSHHLSAIKSALISDSTSAAAYGAAGAQLGSAVTASVTTGCNDR